MDTQFLPSTISLAPGVLLLLKVKLNLTKFEKSHNESYDKFKQECIPVGCVPAARRQYAGVCFPGGVSAWPGGVVCLAWGGVCLVWGGVCLVRGGLPGLGGCLPGLGRGCLPDLGGSLPGLGGCLPGLGGSGIPACTEADTLPSPVDRHTPVKTLPWPQLRCGR